MDAANDAICAAAPVNGLDQRGIARPQGLHCDIGADQFLHGPAAAPGIPSCWRTEAPSSPGSICLPTWVPGVAEHGPRCNAQLGDAALLATVTAPPWAYLDGATGNGTYYYTVVGQNGSTTSEPSNQVGVFRFGMVAGD